MAASDPIPRPGVPEKSPSVQPPPAWTPKTVDAPAVYGRYLDILEGEWVNEEGVYGIHTTPMPSPGTNSETIPGKFHFFCQEYTEKLVFSKVKGSVRNRGGANEQFIAALKYETQIVDRKDKKLIHEENGMYLQMKPVFNRPATADTVEEDLGQPELAAGDGAKGPYFVPFYTINRSGTIPHGSTISLLGNVAENQKGQFGKPLKIWNKGGPKFPTGDDTWVNATPEELVHLSISQTMGGSSPFNLDLPPPDYMTTPTWITEDPSSNVAYTQRILLHDLYPYSVRPDLRLRDTLRNQKQAVVKYALLHLDSDPIADSHQQVGGPKGGVLNAPFVQKFVKVSRMRLNMWLEKLEDGEWQLQYEQIVDFEFHFGTNGGVTVWPHIQVNTLRKVKNCGKKE